MKFNDLKLESCIVLVDDVYKRKFLVTWIDEQKRYVMLSRVFNGKNLTPQKVLEADFNREKWELLE